MLIRNRTPTQLVTEQLPAFAGALAIAEASYKFGSFSLECLAFLATWFVFDFAVSSVRDLKR